VPPQIIWHEPFSALGVATPDDAQTSTDSVDPGAAAAVVAARAAQRSQARHAFKATAQAQFFYSSAALAAASPVARPTGLMGSETWSASPLPLLSAVALHTHSHAGRDTASDL